MLIHNEIIRAGANFWAKYIARPFYRNEKIASFESRGPHKSVRPRAKALLPHSVAPALEIISVQR